MEQVIPYMHTENPLSDAFEFIAFTSFTACLE